MREGLEGEASEMVKNILAAVLESAGMWSRDVIEVGILLVSYCMSIWSEGNQAKSALRIPKFDDHHPSCRGLAYFAVVIWYYFLASLRSVFALCPPSVQIWQ